MKGKVLITGGTGMLGVHLTHILLDKGYVVEHLSRSRNSKTGVKTWAWDLEAGTLEEGALDGVTDIIHLAGAGIADKKWTASRKKVLIDSRVEGPKLLKAKLEEKGMQLRSFISASGVNYYGSVTTGKTFVEDDPAGTDFTGECCVYWEDAADLFADIARVVKIRIGVVLMMQGGALPRLAQPIRYGIGSRLASGKQIVPWIHLEDVCQVLAYALENEQMTGAYNAVASEVSSNADLTKAVAKQLKKPLWAPPVPAFVLKLLFGEMASLVLNGSAISNQKLLDAGFELKFNTLASALQDLMPRK